MKIVDKVLITMAVIVIAMVVVVGCTTTSTADRNKVGNTGIVKPVDYGNGVLYFPCIESVFANSLSDYLESNPSITVNAMAGDGNGFHGSDDGYYVIVEKR